MSGTIGGRRGQGVHRAHVGEGDGGDGQSRYSYISRSNTVDDYLMMSMSDAPDVRYRMTATLEA